MGKTDAKVFLMNLGTSAGGPRTFNLNDAECSLRLNHASKLNQTVTVLQLSITANSSASNTLSKHFGQSSVLLFQVYIFVSHTRSFCLLIEQERLCGETATLEANAANSRRVSTAADSLTRGATGRPTLDCRYILTQCNLDRISYNIRRVGGPCSVSLAARSLS